MFWGGHGVRFLFRNEFRLGRFSGFCLLGGFGNLQGGSLFNGLRGFDGAWQLGWGFNSFGLAV